MEGHFTYSKSSDMSALKQGDVLTNSGKLKELVSMIHPHYSGKNYKYFQVLTQSCDLVRRGEKCSSRYITLAAVRDIDTVIHRAVMKIATTPQRFELDDRLICSDKHKQKIERFIESLFNNNDKNHFFLKAYPEVGLDLDSCAFLHLSIAIKSNEHFDKCLEAKILELDSEFQAKLGWMVGNLYSRVGTKDFVPHHFGERREFIKYINDVMDEQVTWVPANFFSEVRKLASEDSGSSSLKEIGEKAILIKEQKKEQKIMNLVNKINREIELGSTERDKIMDILRRDKSIQL